jgi:zinc D-Ala-D-Ala carboxypeptidase
VNLSPNFTLAELTFSETAIRMGRDVVPDEAVIANLQYLCETVLEPLRAELGTAIVVSSGYRPDWLNRAIGGSATSEHMSGRAADIRAINRTPLQVCRVASTMNLPTNQLILEFGRWCHISVAPMGEQGRRQVLTAKIINGKAVYYPGLVA